MNILSAIGARWNATGIVGGVILTQILLHQSRTDFRQLPSQQQKEIVGGTIIGGAILATLIQAPIQPWFRGVIILTCAAVIWGANLYGKRPY